MSKVKISAEDKREVEALLFHFGQQIHAGRKRQKITQADLGELIGRNRLSSAQDIGKIENGLINISIEKAVRIASAMGMRLRFEWSPLPDNEKP